MSRPFQGLNFLGKEINFLTILEFNRIVRPDNKGNINRFCIAKCRCGNIKEYLFNNIKNGMSKSCGCKPYDGYKQNASKHKLYNIYANMIQRCYNPKTRGYKYYGGRGIGVCDRWKESFFDFLADMGERPSKDYSIDRIDNDGNYEPLNCKWATDLEQAHNKRYSHKLTTAKLSGLVGYSKERIRQLTVKGILKKYVIYEANTGKNNRYYFDNSVIDFLRRRKNKNIEYFKRYS